MKQSSLLGITCFEPLLGMTCFERYNEAYRHDEMSRKFHSLHSGATSEQKFMNWLNSQGVEYEDVSNTKQDFTGKVDLLIGDKSVQVKSPSGGSLASDDLTVEHRTVSGDVGWLYRVDYIIKFCDDRFFLKIPAASLREAVKLHLPTPPAKAPRSKAIAMGGWYARPDWKGRDRSRECCFVVTKDWILTHTASSLIDTTCKQPSVFT